MAVSFESNPRFLIDIPHQYSQQIIESIQDYEQEQLVSLEQACQPLETLLGAELSLYVTVAKLNCQQPKHELSQDEAASVYLYTMEWDQPQNSLHILLNQALCHSNENQLHPWLKYLKLLFTALFKVPYGECHRVWRGISKDVREDYREGDEMSWWTLTSVTSSLDVLQSPMYLGREKIQTIFEIETKYGKPIREYSHLQNDDEILLLPGINLKVIGSSKHSDGFHIIHLREINSFVDLLLTEYHNPKLEEIIQSTEEHGTLSLDSMNLNDQDMGIIVKLGVRDKRCIVISLCNNAITSVGASILSQMFTYRNYFRTLILDGNQILDKGVEAIAKNASGDRIAVRVLKLNSVGMTDVGCQYLAKMVRVNHSIYHIYLNDNQIGNRGLRVLLATIESCDVPDFISAFGLTVCSSTKLSDQLYEVVVSTPEVLDNQTIRILLPNDYFTSGNTRRYPVLYLLHGATGSAAD
ncbi:unnamed protein product [Adineta ricciae]|uniref:NAD(P)(+)--arginine ADP-ribosyltransferase n=2 Tax=Adineta ricciae TaxID=249248 RepID=A0A814AWX3_ADIRI|nr:unnamed protein product [Adineta ricciae]